MSSLSPSVFIFFLFLCHSLGMTRHGEISVFRAERYYSLTVEDRFPEVFIGQGSELGKHEKALRLLREQLSSEPDCVYGDSEREDHFAFPDLKSMIGKLGERELSELSWDAIPEAPRFLEDMESETSSDLFEIDTLSVSEQTLNSTQESDCGSTSITAKTGHQPELLEDPAKKAAQKKSTAEKDFRRSKSSKRLGCKSFKAVTVVETAHRTTKTKKTKPSTRAKNISTLKL